MYGHKVASCLISCLPCLTTLDEVAILERAAACFFVYSDECTHMHAVLHLVHLCTLPNVCIMSTASSVPLKLQMYEATAEERLRYANAHIEKLQQQLAGHAGRALHASTCHVDSHVSP